MPLKTRQNYMFSSFSQNNFKTFQQTLISCLVGFKVKTFDLYFKICGTLRDLVPFVQFKKHEKHPWRSVNFSKVAGFSLQLY